MELRALAGKDANYAKLMEVAANNLGMPKNHRGGAYNWLEINASEAEGGSEEGVVDEVNGCIDLL